MTTPDRIRHVADVVEASAIGDRLDALLVLWAGVAESAVAGTLREHEAEALLRLMRG